MVVNTFVAVDDDDQLEQHLDSTNNVVAIEFVCGEVKEKITPQTAGVGFIALLLTSHNTINRENKYHTPIPCALVKEKSGRTGDVIFGGTW